MKVERINISGWNAALRGERNPLSSWARADTINLYDYMKNNQKHLNYFKLCNGKMGTEILNDEEKITFEDRTNVFNIANGENLRNYKICFDNKSNLYLPENDQTTYVDMDVIPIIGPNDMRLCKQLISGGTVHSKFARYIVVTMDITASLDFWKELFMNINNIIYSYNKIIFNHPLTIDNFSTSDLRDVDIAYIKQNIIPYLNGVINDEHLSTLEKTRILSKMNLLGFEITSTIQFNFEILNNLVNIFKQNNLYEIQYFLKEYVIKLPYFKEFYL